MKLQHGDPGLTPRSVMVSLSASGNSFRVVMQEWIPAEDRGVRENSPEWSIFGKFASLQSNSYLFS
jgi:hypothetical protein